ncbi:hypothetical protein AAFF_G00166840 [Aldrovandia affinis]|uniref:Uncharacterized protein n=1 Tax=Aldrovandia affinis TaxID=143900 RepID=A0AAD7RMF4_9TELE|nr:hypothetical protein AAFF_G00166840 [Aldrovandia affinis]
MSRNWAPTFVSAGSAGPARQGGHGGYDDKHEKYPESLTAVTPDQLISDLWRRNSGPCEREEGGGGLRNAGLVRLQKMSAGHIEVESALLDDQKGLWTESRGPRSENLATDGQRASWPPR